MKIHGRLHRFWVWYSEAGYYSPEEKPWWYPTRLNEWFGEQVDLPPMRWWALYCWLKGGHAVIDDQCNRPEHRYCLYCSKPMPYAKATM